MGRLRRVTAFILITALLITTCLTALPKMCKEVHAEAAVKKIVLVNNGAAAGIQGAGESYLYFGNYKQTSNGNGGFNDEPIKWQVLANADNKLLLLSDMNLDCKQYHGVLEDVTWETSDIRKWLNGLTPEPDTILYPNSFIGTAFSNNERDAIAVTYVIQQPFYGVDVGANTFDKVFFCQIRKQRIKHMVLQREI